MNRRVSPLAIAFAVAALASTARAQDVIHLNEIYAWHFGTDDQEFVELIGTPGMSLDYLMVLVVEGEGGLAGTLDRAWPLTGYSMPADGYFVLGCDLVANLDLSVGADSTLENGTETIYLIDAVDQNGVIAMTARLGTSLALSSSTTRIPNLVAVLDLVAIVDDNYPASDRVYDGAMPLGPDGFYFPAGVFRGTDAPQPWCVSTWLDYDDEANLAMPRTPGAVNGECGGATCAWYCGTGVNLDTFTVSSGLVLGGTFVGTIAFPAPNVGAVLAGYIDSLTFPIWGQEGLVHVGTVEALGLPVKVGGSPVAITWQAPNDVVYFGKHLFVQAAGFGGGAINLTCAYDCTIGY